LHNNSLSERSKLVVNIEGILMISRPQASGVSDRLLIRIRCTGIFSLHMSKTEIFKKQIEGSY
jgi:hypothetical protein